MNQPTIKTTNLGNNVYYDFENINDKYFFAAYTNSALLNILKIFNSVSEIVGVSKNNIRDGNELLGHPLFNALIKNEKLTQQYAIMNLLDRYLPCALVDSKDPKIIGENLKRNIRLLIDYRNFYSHYSPNIKFNGVKKNSLKEYHEKKRFNNLFKKLKEQAIKVSEKRLKLQLNENVFYAEATQEKATEQEAKPYLTFKNDFLEGNAESRLNDFLFLLSLFLTKKEMSELLNCISGKKSTLYPAHRWVRNIFTVLNAKQFQSKITSDNKQQALSLNIMNDLSRIPLRLKDYLTKQGVENLLIKVEEPIEAFTNSEDDELTEHKIELVRHGDSFSYNALQFLELNNFFHRMKFHLHLGKVFSVKPYEKLIANNKVNRELTKNLFVHGRLNNYDDTFYTHLIKKEESVTEFTEPLKYYSPKYHFSNNRIGICFKQKNETIEITDYIDENGKKVFKHKNTISEFIISKNFIPYLVYWSIKTENPNAIEGIFRTFGRNFRRFLHGISKQDLLSKSELQNNFDAFLLREYELQPNWIPTKIKQFLQGQKKDKKEFALRKIGELINRAEFFGYGEKKEDKLSFEGFIHFSFKKGDKATEVAKDIVRMMKVTETKKGIKEKLSSGEFQLLQSILALKSTKEFTDFYNDLSLFKKHPFLSTVKIKVKRGTARTISSYFSEYFKASKRYLEKLKVNLENGKILTDNPKLNFIDFDNLLLNREEIEKYASNLLSKNKEDEYIHPIYIPNDLLKKRIATLNELTDSNKINTTYAIQKGLSKDDKQWFYNEKYRSFTNDKLKFKADKQFRHHWLIDSISWNMLKFNSTDELSSALSSLSLSNYKEPQKELEGSDSILSTQTTQYITFTLNLPDKSMPKVYVKATRKLKDVGAYRHMLKDLRIPYILRYYTQIFNNKDKAILVDTLEEELKEYNKRKLETLKKVFDLEAKIYSKYTTTYDTMVKQNNGTHLNFRTLLETVSNNHPDLETIINIRNKLLHNKLPLLPNKLNISGNNSNELKCSLVFNSCDELITNLISEV